MRSGVLKRAKSFEISGFLDLSPKRTCCNLLDSLKCELIIAKDRASGIGGAHSERLGLGCALRNWVRDLKADVTNFTSRWAQKFKANSSTSLWCLCEPHHVWWRYKESNYGSSMEWLGREELIKRAAGNLKVHHVCSSSSLQLWQQWSKTGITEMADTTRIRVWCRSHQLLAHVGCLVFLALDVVCWGQEISRELDVCEFRGLGFVPKLHVLMQILEFSQATKLLVSVEQGVSFEIERGDLKPDVTDSRLYRNLGATRSRIHFAFICGVTKNHIHHRNQR